MTSKWVWKDREELEANSPSRKDGISSEREEAKRLAYTSLILDAGITMKMCASAALHISKCQVCIPD